MRGVNVIQAGDLKDWNADTNINGKWVPARPYGRTNLKHRIKSAFRVLTGKADVLVWEGQEQ